MYLDVSSSEQLESSLSRSIIYKSVFEKWFPLIEQFSSYILDRDDTPSVNPAAHEFEKDKKHYLLTMQALTFFYS